MNRMSPMVPRTHLNLMEDDPHDALRWLLPLPSPRFLRGLCAARGCSYLAYVHPFCAACCKRKFLVKVKRTMSQEQPGLQAFCDSHSEGMRISRGWALANVQGSEGGVHHQLSHPCKRD